VSASVSPLHRLMLLLAGVLAGYQVAVGIEGEAWLAIAAYTVAFGILLLTSVLVLLFGFDVLDKAVVVIMATLLPLGLSTGLVARHLPSVAWVYLGFAAIGLLGVIVTKSWVPGWPSTLTLSVVHGISGIAIVLLPTSAALRGAAPLGYGLVGIGGAIIGLAGLALALLQAGKPLMTRETVLRILPTVLLVVTTAFVLGFAVG